MRAQSLSAYRSGMNLSIKVLAIILAPLLIYWQDLTILMNEALNNELTNHMLAIPFIMSYIIYRKRNVLRTFVALKKQGSSIHRSEVIGLIVSILAFLLYWHGSYTFNQLEIHMMTLPIFVVGLTLIVFNVETLKALAFPIFLMLFLVPPPLETVAALGAVLSSFSSRVSYIILSTIGLSVTLSTPNESPILTLTDSSGKPISFAIELACSGLYSLTGYAVFASFAAYMTKGPVWKRVVASLIGFPLIYALNILRITIILIIGYSYGQEAAMGVFHLFGGWILIIIGTFILLLFEEKIWKIKIFAPKIKIAPCPHCKDVSPDNQSFCLNCGRQLRKPYVNFHKGDAIKIAAIVICAYLTLSISVPLFSITEGPAEMLVQSPYSEQITSILPTVPGYKTEFLFRDKSFETLYGQDAALVYVYMPEDNSSTLIFTTLEISGQQGRLHKWEECYAMSSMIGKVRLLNIEDVQLSQNSLIIGRFIDVEFVGRNFTQNILYWYEKTFFKTGSNLEWKYAKISVMIYSYGKDSARHAKVEATLSSFAKEIIGYWNPLKPLHLLAKTWIEVTRQRYVLMAILTGLLSVIFVSAIMRNWKENNQNRKIYNRLFDDDKLILQAVDGVGKEAKTTTNEIASTYQKISDRPIENNLLLEKLNYAEEVGLVRTRIVDHNDHPLLVWKNRTSSNRPSKLRSLLLHFYR